MLTDKVAKTMRDRILRGDCVEQMLKLPEASVDLIFADPPYNLQLKGDLHRPDNSRVDAVDDAWDQFSSFKAYDRFTSEWLSAARRALKPNGAIWVIGSYHNIFRIGATLQDHGFWILNDVIWRKSNPMPNFRGKRLTNAHETLIWAARSEAAKYRFNYEALKALNDDLQMRSDWLLPLCTGSERLKDSEGNKAHPTQSLKACCIGSWSGQPIQAMSCLTRSSARAPRARSRKSLADITSASNARPSTSPLPKRALQTFAALDRAGLEVTQSKRSEPRIPFGQIVERGMLSPGEKLYSFNGRHSAKVRADGTLISDDTKGSIHQVGAHLEGAPSCNGWTYWCFKRDGRQVPIDVLRQQVRAELRENSLSPHRS